jgi:hypothetical protein
MRAEQPPSTNKRKDIMITAEFKKVTPEAIRKVIPVGTFIPAFTSYEVTVYIPDVAPEGHISIKGARGDYQLPVATLFAALPILHQR